MSPKRRGNHGLALSSGILADKFGQVGNWMFHTILVHANPQRAQMMRYLVQAVPSLTLLREMAASGTVHEFQRLLNLTEPEVILIDFDSPALLEYVRVARKATPTAAILAIGFGGEVPYSAYSGGLNLALPDGIEPEDLQRAVEETLRHLQGGADPSLHAFLPSKAGSGASTIVLNAAIAAARDFKQRVLVIEADLRSGILSTLLNTRPRQSTEYVLSARGEVTARNFIQAVVESHNVHFLLASRNPECGLPDWTDYFHLIAMVRAQYDLILVDLPEVVNPATVEIVRRSAAVYVVTTPELPALTLARQRTSDLLRSNQDEERIRILVNRWHRSDASREEISQLLGYPVAFVFPNDYPAVRSATLAAGPVNMRSKLGQAYTDFAGSLVRDPAVAPASLAGKLKTLFGMPTALRTPLGRKV